MIKKNPRFGDFFKNYIGIRLKIYYFKVYDKGKLVRNFVPIYQGAKIGDFVVLENGMWDIVEQKFYPNAGTRSFSYGYGG